MNTYISKKPLLYKDLFSKFIDTRGFLPALDLRELGLLLNYNDFYYQLLSHTERCYTFRGFHFQRAPFDQDKLVFIHSGKLIDIVFPINLNVFNDVKIFKLSCGDALFVPKGYAHGFISVSDNVVLQYLMNNSFSAEHYTGIRGTKMAATVNKNFLVSDKDSELPRNTSVEELVTKAILDWLKLNAAP